MRTIACSVVQMSVLCAVVFPVFFLSVEEEVFFAAPAPKPAAPSVALPTVRCASEAFAPPSPPFCFFAFFRPRLNLISQDPAS